MKRGGPLKRRTRLKAKRSTKRRSGRVRDTEYMAWIRSLPCILAGNHCSGRVHAHHAGKRAFGRKASDNTCIPLCAGHHGELHERRGYFLTGGASFVRQWQDARIADYQRAWRLIAGHPHTQVEPCPF